MKLANSYLDSDLCIQDSAFTMDAKKIKLIAAGIVIILMGVIIFQNFDKQTVHILFAEIQMRLAFMLIITFAIGMIAGWILTFMVKGKKKNITED